MYDAAFVEQNNRPAVPLCNHGFAGDGKAAAAGRGVPGVRQVPEMIPCECTIPEQITNGIAAVADDIVAALTKPLTAEEQSPKARATENLSRIVFKGSYEEINRFFYKRGWTDGLPIVPPTEEAVQEMLRGTDLSPDHLVAKILPRLGKATVEKIAIAAVMAGALPTYMPLLIAAVQAMTEPRSKFDVFGVSAGSWSPFWIINGPIRRQVHINCSSGALSPGDIANATIGRAMSILVKITAGVRKGIEDMGTLGNPGKYTMVVGEDEESSPWEPLHVQHGFDKEDNCVTLSFPNSYLQVRHYGTDADGILRGAIFNTMPIKRGMTLMVIPEHARILADAGWTKQEIAEYIAEYARVPAYRHPHYGGPWDSEKMRSPVHIAEPVQILRSPDWIRVIVAGGPGALMGMVAGARIWVTKKAELPKDWDKLVKKYKDVVPTYIR